MSSGSAKFILIADPDLGFADELRSDPESARLSLMIVDSAREAQAVLARTELTLRALFLNTKLIDGAWTSVVRFSKQHRPKVPVFVICDTGNDAPKAAQLQKFGIDRVFVKPVNCAALLAVIPELNVAFDAAGALKSGKGTTEVLDAPIPANDEEFVPIEAKKFVSGNQSFFDVYVRLASGRYIKVLASGDAFSPDRIESYLKKNVENFYIRKESYGNYVAFAGQFAKAVAASPKISSEIKMSQTFNYGDKTLGFFRECGLSAQAMHHASAFVSQTQGYLAEIGSDRNDHVKNFLANTVLHEHGVSTVMICSLLVGRMGITAPKSFQVVGTAALLHDIGLNDLPPELQTENQSQIKPAQLALFQTHPHLGARSLEQIPKMDEAVIQAVEQHHERRGGLGFPSIERPGGRSVVGEIVGIADEFAHLLLKHKGTSEWKSHMEWQFYKEFSGPISQAFRAVFLEGLDP